MLKLSTYLLLDGTCKQAMEFYKSVFGGELTLARLADTPMKDSFPEQMHDRVINARLKNDIVDISASDWMAPNEKPVMGNMVCMYLSGGTEEEAKKYFDKLSEVLTLPIL
jgi:PhnB protein